MGLAVWADGTNVLVEATAQGYVRVLYDADFLPVFMSMEAARVDIRRNAPDCVFLDQVKWERGVYVRVAPRELVTP